MPSPHDNLGPMFKIIGGLICIAAITTALFPRRKKRKRNQTMNPLDFVRKFQRTLQRLMPTMESISAFIQGPVDDDDDDDDDNEYDNHSRSNMILENVRQSQGSQSNEVTVRQRRRRVSSTPSDPVADLDPNRESQFVSISDQNQPNVAQRTTTPASERNQHSSSQNQAIVNDSQSQTEVSMEENRSLGDIATSSFEYRIDDLVEIKSSKTIKRGTIISIDQKDDQEIYEIKTEKQIIKATQHEMHIIRDGTAFGSASCQDSLGKLASKDIGKPFLIGEFVIVEGEMSDDEQELWCGVINKVDADEVCLNFENM